MHPGYQLNYYGFTRNLGVRVSIDVGLTGTILRSEWKAREMGGVVIELDARDQEV